VAENRFGDCSGQTLSRALGDLFANPAAVLYRLQTRAMSVGSAREDVVTRRGHVRLSVHRVGEDSFLWRLEEMVDRSAGGRGAETLSLPMLTVSKSGTVLFMNEAMRRIVGGRVRALDRIFPYLPLRSGEEAEVSGAEGPIRCIVAELEGTSGRREIYLLPAAEDPSRPAAARPDFEDLPLALARISPDGRIDQANRIARELLGLPPRGEGDRGVSFAELLEGPGRPVNDWLADAMAGMAENRPQVLRVRRRDEDSFLQVTLRRVAEAGRPGLLAVFNDATELKSLEAQMVQSQKMQAIGQLPAGWRMTSTTC
jgi:two-component system, cell cycle sensor histidine kinase and response regulator CckA